MVAAASVGTAMWRYALELLLATFCAVVLWDCRRHAGLTAAAGLPPRPQLAPDISQSTTHLHRPAEMQARSRPALSARTRRSPHAGRPRLPGGLLVRCWAGHAGRQQQQPGCSSSSSSSSNNSSSSSRGDGPADDVVLEVLKDAFGGVHEQRHKADTGVRQPGAKQQQYSFGDSQRHAAAGKARRTPTSSSHGSDGNASRTSASRAASMAAAAAAAELLASHKKQRKGPFSELLLSLEQDMLSPQPAAAANHGSRGSSSTAGTHSSSSSSMPAAATAASGPAAQTPRSVATAAAAPPPPRERRSSMRRSPRAAAEQAAAAPSHSSSAPKQPAPQQQAPPPPPEQQPPWLQEELAAAASAPPRQQRKRYAPVPKGDLLLPGGPAWSALRRHLVPAGAQPELPALQCLVIVEGDQDQRAVAAAVNAPVYVCDGTRALKPHVAGELDMLRRLGRPLVVLTDPDERGRELRLHLDDAIGPLLHAFVPEPAATAAADGPVHAAGNRGIEHALPGGVQQALAAAAPSYPRTRAVWSLERLQALQLVNAHDAAEPATGPGGAADRRRRLCAALGLGRCSGAQLLAALNRFFDEAVVEAALAGLEGDE